MIYFLGKASFCRNKRFHFVYLEQSSSLEQDSEMPDTELQEAMARSIHEMRHDPHETPITGGASGSQIPGIAPQQSVATPKTQSEGEGSVIPNRPPRMHPGNYPSQVALRRETAKVQKILDKMTNMEVEFTELDRDEVNNLKQSIKACQATIARARENPSEELIPTPRPQVLPSSIVEPNQPPVRPLSRSRPRSLRRIRGRSKGSKRKEKS